MKYLVLLLSSTIAWCHPPHSRFDRVAVKEETTTSAERDNGDGGFDCDTLKDLYPDIYETCLALKRVSSIPQCVLVLCFTPSFPVPVC